MGATVTIETAADPRREEELLRVAVVEAVARLTELLDGLRQGLAAAVVEARVFEVPVQGHTDADPPTAPVLAWAGADAARLAVDALTRLTYKKGQHPRATVRLPGLLRLDRDWSAEVEAVSQAKAKVRRAMQALGVKRWEHWRALMPGMAQLCRLQAYRAWTWLDTPHSAASFTWSGHSTGHQQLRVAALVAQLQSQYDDTPAPGLANDIEALMALPADEVLVVRRPVAPNAAVNLRGKNGHWHLRKLSLPLLTAQPLPKTIGALADFDPDAARRRRSDGHTERAPLVAHRHAYRYRPWCRFRLARDPLPGHLSRGEGQPDSLLAWTARDSWVIPLAYPTEELERFAAGVPDAGAAPGRPVLGQDPRALCLLAANRANLYLEVPGGAILRVPRADLRRVLASK